MKQYYEAEVLFQLMERDGFNIPSSVPPYEAEIKAYLINQVKQAYPKLTDYEAEWLLYNYTKHLPAEFPISSVTNATSATFENVVPFAYQSAVLKGQTVVNLVTKQAFGGNELVYLSHFKERPFKPEESFTIFVVNPKVSTIRVGLSNTSDGAWYGESAFDVSIIKKILFTVPSDKTTNYVGVNVLNSGDSSGFENSLVILEGNQMHLNIDRYFEGMQSVKTPVLKTTRKNLFDKDSVIMDYVSATDGRIIESKGNGITDFIKVSKGKTYVKNGTASTLSVYSSSKTFIKRVNATNTYTSTADGYIRWNIASIRDVIDTLQIEESSATTSYEPFKSNTLTTPSDLELRGIGEVKDTLDCLTGELTQRIGEIVLDGSSDEDWYTTNGGSDMHTRFVMKRGSNLKPIYNVNQNGFLCDKFKPTTVISGLNNGEKCLMESIDSYFISIIIDNTKLNSVGVSGFRLWLQSNPVKFNYIIEDESIKTVDLKTVNESGESIHFMPLEGTMSVQSSGEIIQPTFDMSVPVEATTQNLASFIDLEMEE